MSGKVISSIEIKPKRVVPNPYNKAEQILEKVNDEEIKFYTPQKIVESNIYSGLQAKLKFNTWKKT